MHIHILGICGKFMSALAIIAAQKGFRVTGSDQNLLPDMVQSLQSLGITLVQGYEQGSLPPGVDCVIIGNALSRGTPIIEELLNKGIAYYSGPEWLARHILTEKWVLAVAGTHGKTTTTSMLTWILEQAKFDPSFLVGGVPHNFNIASRYTSSSFFVIEADEYDTAFFDKRSKFLHYQPRTLIINNLEFDHGDIFKDLDAIKNQFSHLLRIVPSNGLITAPQHDENVHSLFPKGCWTPIETFSSNDGEWTLQRQQADGSEFEIFYHKKSMGVIRWQLIGEHNMLNALAAISAARHVGVLPAVAIEALCSFQGVKRRLELKGMQNGIHVYDDFAHHPTAIDTTLSALRAKVGTDRILAVLEFGSNTMRSGYHEQDLASAFNKADQVILLQPKGTTWQIENMLPQFQKPTMLFENVTEIITYLVDACRQGDHVLCMSNLTFDGIHDALLNSLKEMRRA